MQKRFFVFAALLAGGVAYGAPRTAFADVYCATGLYNPLDGRCVGLQIAAVWVDTVDAPGGFVFSFVGGPTVCASANWRANVNVVPGRNGQTTDTVKMVEAMIISAYLTGRPVDLITADTTGPFCDLVKVLVR
jgi:hypothetical protein